MNYRHGFHAGNHADVLKHLVLVALLDAFRRKPSPFLVLDTHAGRGRYDLADVAVRLGFCSQSHFTAAFRQVYGVTPHRYATGKGTKAGC